jgi:Tfp pilus assembly protein PilF
LQLELASPQAAVGSLKTAIKLNPLVAAYHQELAEAYRKNAQPEEAEREDRQSESLKAQGEFGQPSESGTSKANN